MEDLCQRHLFMKMPRVIGGGADTRVWEACRFTTNNHKNKTGCGFIVKEYRWKPALLKTLSMEQDAARAGIAPYTYVMDCPEKNKVFVIQKRLNGTVTDLLRLPEPPYLSIERGVSALLSRLLLRLQIFHNDLHSDNILYKKWIVKGKPVYRFYLIDFMAAERFTEVGANRFRYKLGRHTRFLDLHHDRERELSIPLNTIQRRFLPDVDQSKEEQKSRHGVEESRRKATQAITERLKNRK